MTRCPNIQRCINCDQLLIHEGSRQSHESASLFGQIIHNLLPRVFTFCDIDGALYRRSIRLLRLFEHKAPGQHRKHAQQEILELLSRIIEHIKNCEGAKQEFNLHTKSGVFLIEGDPHEGNQLGSSKIINLLDGKTREIEDELKMLCWIPLLGDEQDINHVRDKLSRRRCADAQVDHKRPLRPLLDKTSPVCQLIPNAYDEDND